MLYIVSRDAASYSGRTASIEAARQRGALYALTLRGQPREFRYPRWQFDARPDRLAAVLDPFARSCSNSYVVHQFLLTPIARWRARPLPA